MLCERNVIKMEYSSLPQFSVFIYCGIIRTLGTVHWPVIIDKNMLIYKTLWALGLMKPRVPLFVGK